ncbi:MAG TPA: hypothetical protein VFU02_03115 [Polyangiaceae bacterium]|nr:hypothetical protein [Polyangiaceae bacterium]
MKPDDPRFCRQIRLADVGEPGQVRLCAAEPAVGVYGGASVQKSYLLRAGVRRVTRSDTPTPAFPHAAYFQHENCRDVAHGAWLALSQIREILSR